MCVYVTCVWVCVSTVCGCVCRLCAGVCVDCVRVCVCHQCAGVGVDYVPVCGLGSKMTVNRGQVVKVVH